jgi:hypothetical protein
MAGTIWERSDEWVGSQVEDSFVMLSLEHGEYVSLNRTAATVWHGLDAPRSDEQIADTLIATYKVDRADCLESVRTLLDDMAARGLVRRVG